MCKFELRSKVLPLGNENKSRFILHFARLFVPLPLKTKYVRIMTAIQLRAELFREMNPLLDSESAMTKVIAFVKGLVLAQKKEAGIAPRDGWAAAAKQAHADGEDKLMFADVFEDETMEAIPIG